jgi:RNA polymerase sigma-70 factor (ECF subfamily)
MENKPQTASDSEWIQEIRSGRQEAYGGLIRRYHGRVMGYCLSMLRNRSEAEDAVQDIFVKVYRSLDKFKGNSAFSTWLFRITANHCVDALRKRNLRRSRSLDALMESEGEPFCRLFSTPALADSRMENRDLAARLLSALPEDYRVILTLREADGLDYKQIAEVLDCSLETVKGRLGRARRYLQTKLRHQLGQGGTGRKGPAGSAMRACPA